MDEILVTTDADYKDARPVDTVKRIKEILSKYGVETEERWVQSDVPNCYSLRVTIAGTKIGTNGKGVTKEFALASGYGEFMERLQIGNIWRNKLSFEKGISAVDAHSQIVSRDSLLERNAKWYQLYSDRLFNFTGIKMTPRELLDQFVDKNGQVEAVLYYCVTTGTMEHLPLEIVKSVYASNGGAAGNTLEEAIVQAISEIVERNHEMRVIRDDALAPEIPEDVLRMYPIAYQIIQYLRGNGFRVVVKDCSLGTKFPVVCVCVVEIATGKYHTHFGAHPNFEIALQRTLTETFQGRNLKNVARFSALCYTEEDSQNFRRFIQELTMGCAEKKPKFFVHKAQGAYQPCPGFSGSNNRECLAECIDYFREMGYDVLIRDFSSLGFPTCQVIIPGYSDVIAHRFSLKFNDYRYRAGATKALRNPTVASPQDLLSLIMDKKENPHSKDNGGDEGLTEADIPGSARPDLTRFLMNAALGYAYYSLGKYREAIGYLGKMTAVCESGDVGYLVCLKRYLSMQYSGFTPEEIKETLDYFHAEETVSKLYDFLNKGMNPFHDLVLQCDMNCGDHCRLYPNCKRPMTDKLAMMIVEEAKKVDQAALVALFQRT